MTAWAHFDAHGSYRFNSPEEIHYCYKNLKIKPTKFNDHLLNLATTTLLRFSDWVPESQATVSFSFPIRRLTP